MVWKEQYQPSEKFRLDEYGIDNLIDKIYESVKDDYDSPYFDKMFELVRPSLFQAILKIGVKSVARLYSQVESKKEKIRELDEEINNSLNTERYIEACKESKYVILTDIERIYDVIEDIQYNLYEESIKENAIIRKK